MSLALLESIFFGITKNASNETETEVQVAPSAHQSNEGIMKNNQIDLLKHKSAQDAAGIENSSLAIVRVPEKRFIERNEYREAVEKKNKIKNSWVQTLREKKSRNELKEKLILRNTGTLIPKHNFKIEICGTLNSQRPHNSCVRSVDIFQQSDGNHFVYSAGADKTVCFYNLTEKEHSIAAVIELKRTPIWCSALSSKKDAIYLSSDHASLYRLDIETQTVMRLPRFFEPGEATQIRKILSSNENLLLLDKNGLIFHIDERSNTLVRRYNSGSAVRDMCIDPFTSDILCGDSAGTLFRWAMNSEKAKMRQNIHDSLGVLSMAYNRNGLLVGDASGVVVAFRGSDVNSPVKSFSNLSGLPRRLYAHPDLPLCLATNFDSDSNLKLFNTESKTVYTQFPPHSVKLGRLTSVGLSKNGHMLLGNEKGQIKLIKHHVI